MSETPCEWLDGLLNGDYDFTVYSRKNARAELAQLRADLQAAQERIAELEEPLEAFSLAHDLATASIDSPLLVRYAMQLEQRTAEQARQLDAARGLIDQSCSDAVAIVNMSDGYVHEMAEHLANQLGEWIAANPVPEVEPQP